MRVGTIVRRICSSCISVIHAVRLAALVAVVEALTRANRLSVTALGRGVRGRALPKHSIKRVDRLLSNPHLQSERWLLFRGVAQQILRGVARPVVLLDWTTVVDGFSALVAAAPVGGRALTIYAEVHPERRNNKPAVHRRFLRALRDVLPSGCRPIIVVDAGFHGCFFREIQRLGWDFVGRQRQHVWFKRSSGGWLTLKQAFGMATAVPRDLGHCTLYKKRNSQFPLRLVLASSPRRENHPWRNRLPRNGKDRLRYKRAAHEPWLLPTSLEDAAPAAVVALYATRMQIEETFRDAKNLRFGWCLRHCRGSSANRLTLLLLIAAIGALAATLLGLAAEQSGRHRAYQANTVRTRVLSHFVLGLAILRRSDHAAFGDSLASGRRHFRRVLNALAAQATK
jgi:hypothetical protein